MEARTRFPDLLSAVVHVVIAQNKYDAAVSLCEERIKRNGNDAMAYNLSRADLHYEKRIQKSGRRFYEGNGVAAVVDGASRRARTGLRDPGADRIGRKEAGGQAQGGAGEWERFAAS